MNSKLFGIIVATVGVISSWLIMSDSSPFSNLFGNKIVSFFGVLIYPVYIIMIVLGLPDFMLIPVEFAYWFLLGVLIWYVFRKLNLLDPK